jgi:hypothetical protein
MNYFLGKKGVYGDNSDLEYCDDRLPEGYAIVNLNEVVKEVREGKATAKMLAVWMTLCSGELSYDDLISMRIKRMAKTAGVSYGTVVRSLRYFEGRGWIKKMSPPNGRLCYAVNRQVVQKDLPTH